MTMHIAITTALSFALLFAAAGSPAAAQDIRGLEVCTAEKSMERRTSCLQANTQFLQQALTKLTRETQIAARELAAARAEIAGLKAALTKLEHRVANPPARVQPAQKR